MTRAGGRRAEGRARSLLMPGWLGASSRRGWNHGSPRKTRGVTLVEVLVAVTICGAGLALIAGGVSGAVRAESYAAGVSRAVDHADLILARLESGELELDAAKGDFSEDGAPELSWEVAVDTTDTENLSLATVTVHWTSSGVARELVLERLFFVDPEAQATQ